MGFGPRRATFVSVKLNGDAVKKIILAALVTTLTLAPPVPAQSCTLSAYNSCLVIYPGIDWFAIVLQGYCAFVRTFLCDAGI